MASYLETCGLNMGKDLIGSAIGNERGHFEDREFVEFHDDVLRVNRCNMFSPKDQLVLNEPQLALAQKLASNLLSGDQPTGWKDPRSSLFLNLWKSFVPNCRFVFLFRDPMRVIDSLRRRGTDRRILVAPWLPAIAWLRYNAELLRFSSQHPDQTMLIDVDSFIAQNEHAIPLLAGHLGLPLPQPFSTVYSAGELSTSTPDTRWWLSGLDKYYEPRLMRMYDQLRLAAKVS